LGVIRGVNVHYKTLDRIALAAHDVSNHTCLTLFSAARFRAVAHGSAISAPGPSAARSTCLASIDRPASSVSS
jgi:hypothetical protein